MWRVVVAALTLLFAITEADAEMLEGQVVDARTGQPVEGAVVFGRWTIQTGTISENEVHTDAQGRFALTRPGAFRPGDELVLVYMYGYVAWVNSMIFPVDGPPRFGARLSTPAMRQDTRVPPRITLEAFPANGNHPAHVWWLHMLADGDGLKDQRPKLWHAIERESAEAAKRMEELCRNRADCD